jgi:ubiquinone/menaquinone biosynthesis C-methylase UbiE
MKRIAEPELMNDAEQARAYAMADFSEPHQAFVSHFESRFPGHQPRQVLDLGCGPADVSIRFARAYPSCRVVGVDGAEAMLALGRAAVDAADMGARIKLHRLHLPAALPSGSFDTVISNSLLHHLADPRTLWDTLRREIREHTVVFVMDLMRPRSIEAARALVDQHAAEDPEILKRDFFNSLLAAYRPEEVRSQLRAAGLEKRLQVEPTDDRHLLVWGCLQ